jgi:hypothetical protein
MEETARKIEFLAASEAAGQTRGKPANAMTTPEEPVIRIDRIKKV